MLLLGFWWAFGGLSVGFWWTFGKLSVGFWWAFGGLLEGFGGLAGWLVFKGDTLLKKRLLNGDFRSNANLLVNLLVKGFRQDHICPASIERANGTEI